MAQFLTRIWSPPAPETDSATKVPLSASRSAADAARVRVGPGRADADGRRSGPGVDVGDVLTVGGDRAGRASRAARESAVVLQAEQPAERPLGGGPPTRQTVACCGTGRPRARRREHQRAEASRPAQRLISSVSFGSESVPRRRRSSVRIPGPRHRAAHRRSRGRGPSTQAVPFEVSAGRSEGCSWWRCRLGAAAAAGASASIQSPQPTRR